MLKAPLWWPWKIQKKSTISQGHAGVQGDLCGGSAGSIQYCVVRESTVEITVALEFGGLWLDCEDVRKWGKDPGRWVEMVRELWAMVSNGERIVGDGERVEKVLQYSLSAPPIRILRATVDLYFLALKWFEIAEPSHKIALCHTFSHRFNRGLTVV